MTIYSCMVSRYGTMSDYTRICTDAAAYEDGDETGEKRSRAATCNRPQWNWTTMRWQVGHESELRGVKARPTWQRAVSKLPMRRLVSEGLNSILWYLVTDTETWLVAPLVV